LAVIVFVASIVIPALKLASLAWCLTAVGRPSPRLLRARTALHRIIRGIGRWSYIDVFVVASAAALMQFGFIVRVTPGPGIAAFAAVVAATMLAAESFDSRLIWDAAAAESGGSGGVAPSRQAPPSRVALDQPLPNLARAPKEDEMPLTQEQEGEVTAQRSQDSRTRRATVPALEQILYKPLPVLDHGFVRVVDYMGDDAAVVQAARVSYGRGTRRVNEDQGLVNYLMRHRHTTPFEMCEIKFHAKLPIFVARQWIRHRTANVNEYSARYSVLDREFYIPEPEHLAAQATANRQGRGDVLDPPAARLVLDLLRGEAERAYAGYAELLNEDGAGAPLDPSRPGLARELARINLSLGFYTQWYWKIDLHNLMHFLSLRADPHAQYEIRAYAEIMLQILERWVPMTHASFLEYRMNAATISATGLNVIRRLLEGEAVEQPESGLGPREWRELMALLGR
jgi:thymidylate synthase (FAD)